MTEQIWKVKICLCGGPDLSSRIPFIRALSTNGYDITAIGSNEAEAVEFKKHGVPYRLYHLNRRFALADEIKAFYALYKLFKREKFIILHAFDTKPAILARIAARLGGVPIKIGTICGLGSLFSEDSLSNMILRQLYIFSQKIACMVSEMTIFQNKDDKEFFISKRITDDSKMAIIKGSGVDTKRFSSENVDLDAVQNTRNELSLNGSLIVTMVTRIIKYKGVKEYLEAASLLKANGLNKTIFLLIGPPDSTSTSPFNVEEIAKYSNVVHYLGPRSDIQDILYLSDIIVLPSYYREGIPRVLLEAASIGKPLITTNVPGCREVVQDGKNGLLVPPKNAKILAEAIEKLILNEKLRKQMGILSRKKALEEFASDIVFKDGLNLYAKLLENKLGLTAHQNKLGLTAQA